MILFGNTVTAFTLSEGVFNRNQTEGLITLRLILLSRSIEQRFFVLFELYNSGEVLLFASANYSNLCLEHFKYILPFQLNSLMIRKAAYFSSSSELVGVLLNTCC